MTDVDPTGMFDGLDDRTPPPFGNDLLPGVMRRGQHLRHQRRMAYTVGSACAVVLIAGAAVGVAGSGHSDGKQITPLVHTSTPTPHHTKKVHHPHTESPGATTGTTTGGGNGTGNHHPPKPCVTPTATPTDAMPSATPTPTPTSVPPTAQGTDAPAPDSELATTPPRTPPDPSCASPSATPTDIPTQSEAPTPTYSLPPLLSGGAHPREALSSGIL
jgi:hypothetical protein